MPRPKATADSSTNSDPRRRASAYLRRLGTEAEPSRIRRRLVATLSELSEVLEQTPAELRRQRPGPGRWSVQEVVDHLVSSHRPGVAQLRQILAGESPEDPIPADLLSEDPFATPWQELAEDCRRAHAELLEAFDQAAAVAAEGPITATGPILMVVKDEDGRRLEWVERFEWKAFTLALRVHVLEHVHQIRRTLAELEGRPAGST
ncbi:MAG: DinB family protein [Holophagales bacterium]|nr:DinB family protein [Holophagales bacterium]